MAVIDSWWVRTLIIFIALVSLSCSAVWSVEYYINQDGTPHLYNGYLIAQLVKGNAAISQFTSLNLVPNLTGHWLLAALLLVFVPATTTKIIVTLTFGAFVASVGWLRFQVAGREGLVTSLLVGTVLAFNWMWFLGFYNFLLAAASFAFSLGLWWRWRRLMTPGRALCLFILLVFTFFSHLVSFGLLIAAISFLLLVGVRSVPRKSLMWTIAAMAATGPLVLSFLRAGRDAAGMSPQWRDLHDPFSVSEWVTRFIAADPFLLISRKAAPFLTSVSPAFSIFSSALWLTFAIVLLFAGTLYYRRRAERPDERETIGWAILSAILVMFWAVGPDDLGVAHGAFLRERALILGLVCIVPFFRLGEGRVIRYAAHACLAFVIVFQTLVLWDYSHRTDVLARQFFVARDQIGRNESLGSIIFMGDTRRFRPMPLTNLTPYLGIGKDGMVWDNYELGYYLFPVIANTPEHRHFVYEFRESNTYDLGDANENVAEKRARLDAALAAEHDLINILLVWNEQAGFAEIRQKWFESEPYFSSGELKMYRHQ